MDFDFDNQTGSDYTLSSGAETTGQPDTNQSASSHYDHTKRAYLLPGMEGLSEVNSSMEYLGFGVPNTPLANKIIHYFLGILLTLIGVAGATGNGLVLYVFTRYRRLRGGGVPLILSLAAGDLSVSLLHILPAISSFRETWIFGNLGCELYAAAVGLCGLASLLTLSVIAAERFSVIMGAPIRWLSSKKACLLIWVLSFVLVFPPFVGWSKYVREGMGTSCSWDYVSRDYRNRVYYIFLLTFGFFVPVSIIVVSYLGILQVVCKQSYRMSGLSRSGGISKKSANRSELKTAQVVLSIIICFLISWTPYAVVSMIGQFGDSSTLSPLATALPAVFAKSSVVYNPLVYGLSHPLFRTAFASLKAQYLGKRNASGSGINGGIHSRELRQPRLRNHGKLPPARSKKALVVTARGTGAQHATIDHHHRFYLDGQKMLNGLRGKKKLGNGAGHSGSMGEEGSRTQGSTEVGLTISPTPTTTPCSSFRTKQNMMYMKKGVWVFKKRASRNPSYGSEFTGRTVLPFNESSGADVAEDLENSTFRCNDDSDLSSALKSGGGRQLKNSYTFFLCEYRKKRQEAIRQKFFQSENCLNDLFRGSGTGSSTTKLLPSQEAVVLGNEDTRKTFIEPPDSFKVDDDQTRENFLDHHDDGMREKEVEREGNLALLSRPSRATVLTSGSHGVSPHLDVLVENVPSSGTGAYLGSNFDGITPNAEEFCSAISSPLDFKAEAEMTGREGTTGPVNKCSNGSIPSSISLRKGLSSQCKQGLRKILRKNFAKSISYTGDMKALSGPANKSISSRNRRKSGNFLREVRQSVSLTGLRASAAGIEPATYNSGGAGDSGRCNASPCTSDWDGYFMSQQKESPSDKDGDTDSLCDESCYVSCNSELWPEELLQRETGSLLRFQEEEDVA